MKKYFISSEAESQSVIGETTPMQEQPNSEELRRKSTELLVATAFNLSLFGEEGGGDAAGEAAVEAGGNDNNNPVAGGAAENEGKSENPRAEYDEFMKNENNKRFFNEDTQKVINRRFRETRQLQEQVDRQNDVLARLYEKYNVTEPEDLSAAIDNDSDLWQEAADEAGMTVDQYKEFQRLSRENQRNQDIVMQYQRQEEARRQYGEWLQEANELKQIYPDFNLQEELQNRDFRGLIGQKNAEYRISMRQAYEVIHPEAVEQRISGITAKQVTDNIKARGMRPPEGAASGGAGIVTKTDVSKLTKKDRAEMARRAEKGEIISF